MEIGRYGSGRIAGLILMIVGVVLGSVSLLLFVTSDQQTRDEFREVMLASVIGFLGFTFYGWKNYSRNLVVFDTYFIWGGRKYLYSDVTSIECEVPKYFNPSVKHALPSMTLNPLGQSEVYWIQTSKGLINILARFTPGVGDGISEIAKRSQLEIKVKPLS